MSTIWAKNPVLVTRLIELWNNGGSASQVAYALGCGLTRSSIAAKVHRLRHEGVKMRMLDPITRSLSLPKPPREPRHRPPVEKPELIQPVCLEDGSFVTVLTARDSHCRYPFGEPWNNDFHYCGRQVFKGSFCEGHSQLCHQPKHPAGQQEDVAA